ncbi:MAG TPA: hypothetical protein VFQ22_05710 [Longimicrobiales bacterium]|nr:hypothetical protein [Longimicrobiales bacterium]
MKRRLIAGHIVPLVVAAAALAALSLPASAQVDVSGTWQMEVTTDAGGTTTPSLTLQQNGAELTGHYTSQTLGEADVTGTVDGSQVTISFSANLQGQEIPVVYAGTVNEEGIMTGTIDLAGGLATGTFTARRAP